MGTEYIQAGACVAPDDEFNVMCALESSQCPLGHSYISNRELKGGLILNSAAKACLSLEKTKDVKLGRCLNRQVDDFICTSHNTACALSVQFNPLDEECNLRDDLTNERATFYSRCWFDQDLNFCVWDMTECTGGPLLFNTVTPASQYQNCRCDEVRTGACYHEASDSYTCAVSALGCDSESTYVRWQDLYFSDATRHIDCQLCNKVPPKSPTRAPTTPFVSPSLPFSTSSDQTASATPIEQSTLRSGELAAAVAIPTLFLALIVACCIGRRQMVMFSSTTIGFNEDDEVGDDADEDQQGLESHQNEILEEAEFQLDKDKEIT
ncbi:unnamed protein product [Cylindrotheca closterium]|uniref:Uncharacterized protein n=1 Tax=Cylindrotheca closterium TaxID=2856 RepID=A0AAD2GD70_9STRA|nr:unnamed protein product [Cylindrotheca closterium]